MFSHTETDVLIRLEIMFQVFRSQHGIGNGSVYREKFLRLLTAQADAWTQEQERKKIKIAFA